MNRMVSVLAGIIFIVCSVTVSAQDEIYLRDQKLFSRLPAFTLVLPAPFQLIHSSLFEHPEQSSRTRVYFLITEKAKRVEELLIVQIADKTNPRAEPMTVPPMKSTSGDRTFSKGKTEKAGRQVEYVVQLMKWNPMASALKPIMRQGFFIPARLALQGQFQFIYETEHAVFLWYSRDVTTFGLKVTDRVERWKRGGLSGNEKKAVQIFEKMFLAMTDSITFGLP